MLSFLLVHGAWHDRRCWEPLVSVLRARGHNVAAPTLPGHGSETRNPFSVSMKVYGAHVNAVASALPGEVICVGHSLGGMVISQAAELRPELYHRLVFLAAIVPDGKSGLAKIAGRDTETLLVPERVSVNWWKGTMSVPPENVHPIFYQDCPQDMMPGVISTLCPQPIRAMLSPVRTTEGRFGSVSKAYLECSEDRAISLSHQREMQTYTQFDKVDCLPSSHSPFLSMPERMADALEKLAKD